MSGGDDEDRLFDQGRHCARTAIREQKAHIASLPDAERLLWWCGFLTAGMGAAVASLGEPAVRALRSALDESGESVPHRSKSKIYVRR